MLGLPPSGVGTATASRMAWVWESVTTDRTFRITSTFRSASSSESCVSTPPICAASAVIGSVRPANAALVASNVTGSPWALVRNCFVRSTAA